MKILVTGVNGQLGHDVMLELGRRGHEAIGSGSGAGCRCGELSGFPYMQMDSTDREQVCRTVGALRPDAVIHCSAWTAVDAAEEPENREKVFALNARGPELIAESCAAIGTKMIQISTDYVFDGRGERPRRPDDPALSPVNIYGESKLQGEKAVASALEKYYIVRTAWVFGKNGNNFVKTMLELGRKHGSLRVVDDQIGTPTYTRDLARLLADMAESDRYGVYHATNSGGFISWYDFAKEIFSQAGIDVELKPVSTAEYGASKAKRPLNSRMNKDKLAENGFAPLPHWKDALRRYLKELGEI